MEQEQQEQQEKEQDVNSNWELPLTTRDGCLVQINRGSRTMINCAMTTLVRQTNSMQTPSLRKRPR